MTNDDPDNPASWSARVRRLLIDLDALGPAERRDLANALLRAAWSAALGETRIMLLDLFLEIDPEVPECGGL